jgi:hypothetical protein
MVEAAGVEPASAPMWKAVLASSQDLSKSNALVGSPGHLALMLFVGWVADALASSSASPASPNGAG